MDKIGTAARFSSEITENILQKTYHIIFASAAAAEFARRLDHDRTEDDQIADEES